jgi:hypothetical protein
LRGGEKGLENWEVYVIENCLTGWNQKTEKSLSQRKVGKSRDYCKKVVF